MKKTLKTIFINLLVLLILLIPIELIFGSWLIHSNSLNNLFIIRDQVLEIELNGLYPYHKPTIKVTKDRYGFRGSNSSFNSPEKIDILCVGGSTTYQLYIEDGYTWPEVLEKELKSKNVNLSVANAGIDGQSTFGHLKNFELWFPQVPELSPEYIFFYIGINDFFRLDSKAESDLIGRQTTIDRIKGKIKDNSATYRVFKALSGTIEANTKGLTHSKVNFSDFIYGTERLLSDDSLDVFFQNRLTLYAHRLEQLVAYSRELGSTPVFITQPSRRYKFSKEGTLKGLKSKLNIKGMDIAINGLDYYYCIEEMNKIIQKVARENQLLVIDQTNVKFFSDEDFYDFNHTTPSGSLKIGSHIAHEFIEYLNEKAIDQQMERNADEY